MDADDGVKRNGRADQPQQLVGRALLAAQIFVVTLLWC